MNVAALWSLGPELIGFVCPRCAWRHESPLFR
jgi:hypothetical protein